MSEVLKECNYAISKSTTKFIRAPVKTKWDVIVYDNRYVLLVQTPSSSHRPSEFLEFVLATNENLMPIERGVVPIAIYDSYLKFQHPESSNTNYVLLTNDRITTSSVFRIQTTMQPRVVKRDENPCTPPQCGYIMALWN
ncbi:unnamed protein product [Didymodactylos carnosus]|uniref:Uncharacterized protein n=1 Tax=Didymodactylos carnosus TaxID=1234261 RepID=A0A814GL55_9BILA|nr:unnamed protein product [Didymodactylos carnosus]CAF3769426.1 unnamed protein product [Didymodactylos carnosus]